MSHSQLETIAHMEEPIRDNAPAISGLIVNSTMEDDIFRIR